MKFDLVERMAGAMYYVWDKIEKFAPLVLAAVIIFFTMWVSRLKTSNETLIENLKKSQQEVAVYKDKNDKLVYQIGVMTLNESELKSTVDLLGIDKKRLTSQVGKLSNLVSYWQGKASMTGRIDTVYRDSIIYTNVDTVAVKKLDWSNGFLSQKQVYYPQTDKVTIDYTYSTGIELTVFYKKRGLFKKKELVADLRFEDQNMKLDSAKMVLVDKTQNKKWYQRDIVKIGAGFLFGRLL